MKHLIKKIAIGLVVQATMVGCVAGPGLAHGDKAPDTETPSRTAKTLLMVGGLLLLSAIVVNEAESNVEDAVRNAASP